MAGRFRMIFLVVALFASLFLAGSSRAGSIIFVNDDAASGGDGASWATAYAYLQDALTAARNSNGSITEIWVAAGTYKPDRDAAHPNGTADQTAAFKLVANVAIRGGFAGNEELGVFNLGNRNFAAEETVLSGDLAGDDGPNFVNNSENSYNVVATEWPHGSSATAILDGFTVFGGNATGYGQYPYYWGGGFYCPTGSPTVINCTFTGNSAISGGGMYTASSPKLSRCRFIRNKSTAGGGFYSGTNSIPTLTDCSFYNNLTTSTSPGGGGGGIFNNSGSRVTLTNCTICGNSAAYGGGINTYAATSLAMINCTISGNSASSSGGGVYGTPLGPSVAATNCIVWGNSAGQLVCSATVTYSCVEGGAAGSGNISLDPRLLSVATGSLRIHRSSPCIDAGNSGAVPAGIVEDLDGNSRFVDDPDTANTGSAGNPPRPVVDMGAYEYQPGPAERLYVKSDALPGGDGAGWATAFQYLQDALAAGQTRPRLAEIWVSKGVYKPDRDAAHPGGTGDRAATFSLLSGVALRGGFEGNEDLITFSLNNRDLHANESVLNGDLAGDDGVNFAGNSENTRHLVTSVCNGPGTVLDGFTVSSGNADGSASDSNGAGMRVSGGAPTVTNCTFTGNSARDGAGIESSSTGLTVTRCIFIGNLASSDGGGMRSPSGNATLINCAFRDNSYRAISTYPSGGATLANCTLVGNPGGTNDHSSSTTVLTNCIAWGNGLNQVNGWSTVRYSCIQNGRAGQGNIGTDPGFLNQTGGDLRLSPNSPCIDAGKNAAVPSGTLADLAGRSRFVDDLATPDCRYSPGTCGAAPVVDMGAYEFNGTPADFDQDDDVDTEDFTTFQACVSGPAIPFAAGCAKADKDRDSDVDQSDFGLFQRCLSEAGVPASPLCAN